MRLPRPLVVVAAAVIAVADLALRLLDPPYVVAGLLDEPAHLAPTALVLANWPSRLARATLVAALAASVLIDADHLPALLGTDVVTAGAPRPYSHALLTPLLLLALAAVARGRARPLLGGAALGVACHLLRDLAGEPGVPLVWPLSSAAVSLPFLLVTAVVAALAARAWAVR